MKKIKIAIDIDEILRSKTKQFNRYYVEEFGEEGVPENPFTLDFYNKYKWNNVTEKIKVLKDNIDENAINPIDYHPDKDGNILADLVLFNTETNNLTSLEVYKRFLYQDFVFEIFGTAPKTYRDIDVDFGRFITKYSNLVDFYIISDENYFSIPPTLFFLSKIMSRCKNYAFYDKVDDIVNTYDYVITTNPLILNVIDNNKIIKLLRPYNKEYNDCIIETINLIDLYENEEFEKLINVTNE